MPCAKSSRTLRLISLLVPPLLLMAAIFYTSAQPNFLPTQGFWETSARKIFHGFEYFALTLLWIRALRGIWRGWSITAMLSSAFLLAFAFASSDELHQAAISGRHGRPRDVAIDTVGIAVALVAGYARLRSVGPSRPKAA